VVAELAAWVRDARARTLELAASLERSQLLGPQLAIVNPPLWELGHVAWFQERWVLRHAGGERPLLDGGDGLYDSAAIPHDARWTLPLPSLDATVGHLRAVEERVLSRLAAGTADPYFVALSVFHEDMHLEAMAFSRQTLGWATPRLGGSASRDEAGGALAGDVDLPGGPFQLGATPGDGFAFDNEKWAHEVVLRPFAIARAPVTQREYAAFVEDGGYRRAELWSAAGWRWRDAASAEAPVYWTRRTGGWQRREFDRWVPLEPHRPVVNVCWFEAEAYCRWAGRRLPVEAEWEAAAASAPPGVAKRRFPWGEAAPTAERAHLGARALHALDVGALAAGESASGCRQLLGNVWEWTASDFLPYPGFTPDPYREYSQPWFGSHKVLRGGSFATPARLLRNTWRNFYTPDRRDPWAGFRTCAA
jgi:iron(II)-dependent oxidoreductase